MMRRATQDADGCPHRWTSAARSAAPRLVSHVPPSSRYHRPVTQQAAIPTAVVFDLGGVLIDWDPRHLYRQMFADPQEMEVFLRDIVSPDWNAEQDAGRTWAEATALLIDQYPDHEELIRVYAERWQDMLAGPIAGSVAVLAQVRDQGTPIYALTNWSAETFPRARALFPFLDWFRGIVVSGDEGIRKPDPEIWRRLIDRYQLDPDPDGLHRRRAAERRGRGGARLPGYPFHGRGCAPGTARGAGRPASLTVARHVGIFRAGQPGPWVSPTRLRARVSGRPTGRISRDRSCVERADRRTTARYASNSVMGWVSDPGDGLRTLATGDRPRSAPRTLSCHP